MLAAESRCAAVVDLLTHRGAHLSVVDSLGYNILHYAKLSGSLEIQDLINSAFQWPHSKPGMFRTLIEEERIVSQ